LTAAAIANDIGIFSNHKFDTIEKIHEKFKLGNSEVDIKAIANQNTSLLLNGSDLCYLNDAEWRIITKYDEVVFARTTPEQKLLIVKKFQRDGYVVGVTGDGVNDAPALKNADIGIAMGSGSEVAMEASQLVLLDNNFSSILIAIRNGRLVFGNLRKVILYLLPGGCVAELVPVLLSIFLGVPQSLSSFQMLIISLFTDVAPSLSLMMERAEVDLLKQPPRSKKSHLVDWKFIIHAYLFLGIMISFFSQCMFYIFLFVYHNILPSDLFLSFGYWPDGYKGLDQEKLNEIIYQGQTVTYVSLILLQIFGNLLSTRTHVRSFFQSIPFFNPFKNCWLLAAQATSISILFLTIYVPFFNEIFKTRQIPFEFFMIPFLFCILVFTLDELRKLMVRKKVICFHKVGW
jgi:sodium/potassium-transporting ATPase subunit alpha